METNHLYAPDMETTFYGRILQDIMKRDGFSANIIENYNNEVINKIRELILNTKIPVANGKVSFENVEYEKPYEHVGGKKEPLYPAIARAKTTPYFASIEADMVFTPSPMGVDPITGKPIEVEVQGETRKRMVLGSIPAMLGSKLCWLNKEGVTEAEEREERTKLGECPNDPLGYFIIKSERVIVTQENLRNSVFYIYSDKDSVVDARITCPTQQGTTIVEISINKHSCVRVNLQHLNKKDFDGLPVFLLFKLLGFTPEQALEKIYTFIKPEHRVRISYAVQPSIAEFQSIPTDVMEGYINYVLRIREKNDVNKVIREENILPDIYNELFSNISEMDLKITHLAMYCAKMLEYMIGERKLDDRDSWANKQLITGGFSITKLFKVIWWSMMSEIKRKSELMNGLNAVRSIYMSSRIQDNFVTAFGPSGWGLMKHIKKENITDSLKRETPLSVYSQLSHVNTPTSRQSKTPEIRAVHPSQLGYICLYDSPDGDTIGLVKSLACTCYISLERDANIFLLMLKEGGSLYDYTSKNKIKDEQVPLLVNGIIRTWCVASEVVPILRDMRRNGIVHKDACIFHNIKDNTVEIYCDGGRPTRPLFTVNPDNHQLEVINKGLETASIDTLIREGCIEYIDAREQEYILLSQSFDDLQNQRMKFMIGEKFVNFSHCEIDPFAIFSIAASLVPMANRQAGPRTSFQASMFKQALGQFHSNEHRRFDTSFKMIYYPTKAIFQNDSEEVAGLNYMPTGTTLQVAIYAHPDTQEDAILFKEEAIKYGSIFDMAKKITITSIAKSNNVYNEVFERPALVPGEPEGKYAHIDENGLPKLDAFIRQGDCIIGKVRKFPKDGRIESIPEYAAIGVEGYVDRILITQNPDGYPVVRVKMRKNRKYIPGDKLACFEKNHNILTNNRGWIQITDVTLEDSVATLNDKKTVEYQNPIAIHHYTYKGSMYSIKGKSVDQIVTPEHRMFIKKQGSDKFELDQVHNWMKEGNNTFNILDFDGKEITEEVECKIIDYDSSVHCVTVSNGIVYVEHNGIPSWSGNSRFSQKGTVSKVVPARFLPRIADGPNKGMVPDIFINPHGQPSRMTINKIFEIKTTKAALISGRYINSTTFRSFEEEMTFAEKTLGDYGFDIHGKENFEMPNGTPVKNRIFCGPCYYQALRHHVSDKIQMRARGGIKPDTRQPVSGRAKEGGLRVGEMERDALISHGSSSLLRERMCDESDAFNLPICAPCGTIAITNHITGVYTCKLCGDKAKFGIIRIPYATKLLLHYLNASGIHMTFKTENMFGEITRPEENYLK